MTTAKVAEPVPVPTVWEEEPTGFGYFQISLSGMQHVMQNASERALPVYIACWGGVDRTNAECPRACTHGAKAIEARTGMNRKTCVPALMEELFGIDALRRLPEIAGSNTATREAKGHAATCLVDPDRTDDLVDIDQRFLDPHHGAEKRPARQSVRGVTSDFMRLRYSQGGRRGGRSFTDAILLYFALHGHFDLERFAAVDPQVAHGRMTPLDDAGPIEGLEHVMPLFYNDGQRLVLVKEAGFPRISDAYAQQLFKDLPSRTGEAPESRAAAALGVLRLLGFVTTAYVLWTASPFTERDAAPLVTLYVKGGSSFTDGRHVAHVIDAVVKETDTIPGRVMYPKDAEDGKSVFSGTGIYRYIVDEDEVASSVVLTQLRLKHVADSDSQRAGLVVEKLRRDDYLGYLHSLARL